MKLKSIAIAALASVAGLAGATTSWNLGPYTVSYDETTAGFGYLAGASFGGGGWTSINWAIDPVVQASSSTTTLATFTLPNFTITANPGYTLSGPITFTLGNISYAEFGNTAATSITATGSLTIDANPTITLPATPMTKVVTSPVFGYFADTATLPYGAFGTLSVTGGSMTLGRTASGTSFAAIGAQNQNVYKVEFYTKAVPEPETYALMLAGLGLVGWMARRRQR